MSTVRCCLPTCLSPNHNRKWNVRVMVREQAEGQSATPASVHLKSRGAGRLALSYGHPTCLVGGCLDVRIWPEQKKTVPICMLFQIHSKPSDTMFRHSNHVEGAFGRREVKPWGEGGL